MQQTRQPTPSPQPSPVEGEGAMGKSLLPRRKKVRACPGFDPGLRGSIVTPSPQPSPVEGEGVRRLGMKYTTGR